ncbi:MAG TPA: alpha-amylase family protein [Pseudolysinimonas sp.]|nr:alpha-amylase family protein [Pseudolysinimonas sp.]
MTSPDWLRDTVRWGQVNLNEADPASIDLDFWVRYWRECRLQGTTINAGGPVAFYPTEVPYHRRSSFLADGQDLFGDAVHAAKGLGLRVLARLDPTFATQELYDANPDWCVTRPDGTPRTWPSKRPDPGDLRRQIPETSYYACYNGPAFSAYLPAIMREIMTGYDVDGFFTNAWPMLGLKPPDPATDACYCPYCRAEWAKVAPGVDLPTTANAADPIWWRYVAWVQERVETVQASLRDLVIGFSPEATFLSSAFPSLATGLRWDRWVHLIDALGSDAQGRRHGDHGPAAAALWESGVAAEMLQAVGEGKPAIRYTGVYLTSLPARHAARPDIDTRLLMSEALAHGERPKWHTLGGTQRDRRWMPAVAEFYQWLAQIDDVVRERESAAEVGVVWSSRSVQLEDWSARSGPRHGAAIHGWCSVLLQARIPFDLVHEVHLDRLDRYRVIVLPSGLALDDAGVAAVERYRAGGGRVVGMGDALMNDEFGERRAELPHGGLFDVRPTGDLIGPLEHSYLRLAGEDVFFDLGDTEVLTGSSWLQAYSGDAGVSAAPWIPDSPLHPTHAAYLPEPRLDVPVVHRSADGAAILIGMDFDASFTRTAVPDHAAVMSQVVRDLLGADPIVRLEGDGLLDLKLWRIPGGYAAFLVNLDTPGLQGEWASSLRPLGEQNLTIAVPSGQTVTSVRLLRAGTDATWMREDTGAVVIRVPGVNDLEVVRVLTA